MAENPGITIKDEFGNTRQGVYVESRRVGEGSYQIYRDTQDPKKFYNQHGTPVLQPGASAVDLRIHSKELKASNTEKNERLQFEAQPRPEEQQSRDNKIEQSPMSAKEFVKSIEDLAVHGTNVLDDIHSSYHIKLFVMSSTDYQKVEAAYFASGSGTTSAMYSVPHTVIVESGVSAELTVNELEITSVVGADSVHKNIGAIEYKMSIVEALGCSFFDRLQNLSVALGYNGSLDLPMFVEISFRGINSDGTPLKDRFQLPVFVNRVVMNHCTPSISSTGTSYDITLIPVDFMASRPDVVRIPEVRNITAKTVGEFFEKLEQTLNETYIKEQPELVPFLAEESQGKFFKFIVPDDYKSRTFKTEKTNTVSKDIDKTIPIAPGSKLQDVVDGIFRLAQKNPSQKLTDADSAEDKKLEEELIQLPRIIPQVRYGRINPESNVFAIGYEFQLKFDYPNYLIHNGKSADEQSTARKAKLNLIEQRHSGKIKRYSFMFSGVNTDVISADLDFNNLFKVAKSSQMWFSHSVNDRQSIKKPNETDQERKERIKKQLASDPFSVQKELLNSGELSASDIDSNGNVKNQLTKSQQTELDSINKRLPQINETQSKIQGSEQNAALDRSLSAERERLLRRKAELEKGRTINGVSVSDLNSAVNARTTEVTVSSQNRLPNTIKNLFDDAIDPSKNQGLPVKRMNKPVGTVNQIGGPDQVEQTEYRYQSVLQQAYDSRNAMLKLALEIRGDPYWLGQPFAGLATDVAPYDSTHVCVFFDFKLPVDIENGLTQFDKSKLIAGGYQATRIISTFRNGLFTQKLELVRISEN